MSEEDASFVSHSPPTFVQPKPTPKTFAVCTINSTPSEPVHCVVWAKKLYSDLFGPEDTPAEAVSFSFSC